MEQDMTETYQMHHGNSNSDELDIAVQTFEKMEWKMTENAEVEPSGLLCSDVGDRFIMKDDMLTCSQSCPTFCLQVDVQQKTSLYPHMQHDDDDVLSEKLLEHKKIVTTETSYKRRDQSVTTATATKINNINQMNLQIIETNQPVYGVDMQQVGDGCMTLDDSCAVSLTEEDDKLVQKNSTVTEEKKNSQLLENNTGDVTSNDIHLPKRKRPGLRPHKCTVCGAGFNEKHTLDKHKKRHAEVKPPTCDICNVAISQDGGNTIHKCTNTNKKSFKCSVCGIGFLKNAELKNMRRYIKTRHHRSNVTFVRLSL